MLFIDRDAFELSLFILAFFIAQIKNSLLYLPDQDCNYGDIIRKGIDAEAWLREY